jgi:L-lactate dehydrogenase complex protein LldE
MSLNNMNSEPKSIALFVTCLVDQLMPEVGVATVHLLRRAGYEVAFPTEQTCCGQPFLNSGFRKEAARLAKRSIEVFESYEAVVLPSGSCTTMIRSEYPHLLQDSPRWYYPARRLAAKTYELSEFLANEAGWPEFPEGRQPPEGKLVTYHDSCHMCRILKLKQAPRHLLHASGNRVVEMEESDKCCGFGGLFSLRMPEVSNAMTAEKLRQAGDTGVKTVVTADPGCLLQMQGMVGNSGLEITHIANLLEEATR